MVVVESSKMKMHLRCLSMERESKILRKSLQESMNMPDVLQHTLSIRASKFGSGLSDLFDMSFFLHVGHSLFLSKSQKN